MNDLVISLLRTQLEWLSSQDLSTFSLAVLEDLSDLFWDAYRAMENERSDRLYGPSQEAIDIPSVEIVEDIPPEPSEPEGPTITIKGP